MKIKAFAASLAKFIISRFVYVTNVFYVSFCQRLYKGPRVENGPLFSDGVLTFESVLNEQDLSKIISDVNYKFTLQDKCISYRYGEYRSGYHSDYEAIYLKSECLDPEIYINPLITQGVFKKIEEEMGMKYYIRQISVMKTLEGNFTKNGSFAFHRDGHPTKSFKLLVYLTDVLDINSGPTSYIKGSQLGPILPFGVANQITRGWNADDYQKYCILGKKGKGLLFNVNGLHAGGRVITGERIILVYNFQPTHKSFTDYGKSFHKMKVGSWEFDLLPGVFN